MLILDYICPTYTAGCLYRVTDELPPCTNIPQYDNIVFDSVRGALRVNLAGTKVTRIVDLSGSYLFYESVPPCPRLEPI